MAHDSKRVKMDPDTATKPPTTTTTAAAATTGTGTDTKPLMVAGIDASLVSRLPREALIDVILQTLPTSIALQAIVIDKLKRETLHDADAVVYDEEATEEEDVSDDYEDISGEEDEDGDINTQENASGGVGDGIDDSKLPPACRGLGLSPLSKLIMEVMSSAPAPEGGMPWREFEGIWPPVLGTVQAAVDECKAKGLLIAVDAAGEFVESTIPIDPQAVLE